MTHSDGRVDAHAGAEPRRAVQVLPSAAALAGAAADAVVAAADIAIRAHGAFVVALAGGSTPRSTYERLAEEPLASRVAWSRVHVLWGDERCVPPDHLESNYRMARETLLDRVPIPADHVHRIHGEDDPAAAAEQYEATLRALLDVPEGPPTAVARIDLFLLGLGDDGHTASLFPGSAASREQTRWAMAEYAAAVSAWRITLTPAVINTAADVLFLVEGGAKAGILRRVLEGPYDPQACPAQAITPGDGRVRWFVDAAAAADLAGEPSSAPDTNVSATPRRAP